MSALVTLKQPLSNPGSGKKAQSGHQSGIFKGMLHAACTCIPKYYLPSTYIHQLVSLCSSTACTYAVHSRFCMNPSVRVQLTAFMAPCQSSTFLKDASPDRVRGRWRRAYSLCGCGKWVNICTYGVCTTISIRMGRWEMLVRWMGLIIIVNHLSSHLNHTCQSHIPPT